MGPCSTLCTALTPTGTLQYALHSTHPNWDVWEGLCVCVYRVELVFSHQTQLMNHPDGEGLFTPHPPTPQEPPPPFHHHPHKSPHHLSGGMSPTNTRVVGGGGGGVGVWGGGAGWENKSHTGTEPNTRTKPKKPERH